MKTLIFKIIFAISIINCGFAIRANAQIQQNNVRVVDTTYTPVGYPDIALNGLLYLPSITNGAAAVVVHGLGGVPQNLHLWGESLSSFGYVVLVIDYLSFENQFGLPNRYPGPVRAIKTACEFLRKNSVQFGNYNQRVGLIGSSGGAMHSAETIIWDNDDAYFSTDPGINDHFDATVLFYGWYNYYNYLESVFNTPGTHDGLEALLAELFYDDPSLQSTKGNPLVNVDNITSPVLLLHGTADQILQFEQSVEFRDSLLAHNKNVQLELIPGANHVYEFHNSHPIQNFNWNQWSALGEITRDTVLAFLSRTLEVTPIYCPSNKSYWKNHPELWSFDATPMMLGITNSYNKAQLLSILNSSSGDVTIKLAQDLIAAKLNLANNSWAPPIASTIVAADNLIGSRAIPVLPAVASNSAQGIQFTSLAGTLQAYNNGSMTPNCNNSPRLAQNSSSSDLSFRIFPNPVSGLATISFALVKSEQVSLKVFDVKGKLIATVADKHFEAGEIQITWDSRDVNPGIYFLKMETENYSETEKISILK
jgi:acetyl esterase/lipase